ncbi:hypothetical protein [Streptomyces sp. NPDC050560]|uniref:hypothetical protein n=1 Tax=Streptomyces sp. NPDC050560 TaxID=3365630 RepID=UPI0037A8FC89
MHDALLKAAATAKAYANHWTHTTATRLRRNSERGQGAIEYVGIIILVVAIIIALLNTNMGSTIANAFTEKINSVLGR